MPSTFLGFRGTGSEQSRQKALISWSLRPSGESYTKVIQKYFTYNVKYMICGLKLMATK